MGGEPVEVDGVLVGATEGRTTEDVVASCLLGLIVTLAVPVGTWVALDALAGPPNPEATPGDALLGGMQWLGLTFLAWYAEAMVAFCAYALRRSVAAALVGFAALGGSAVLWCVLRS